MANDRIGDLDEIDRLLLRILSRDPRMPYSDIADALAEEGHEMSGEGIRYRVSKLLEVTSVFFLLGPDEHGWEIYRLGITVTDAPRALERAFEAVSELDLWLTSAGLGDPDIYAVGTAVSNEEINRVIGDVRAIDAVKSVDFSIETRRQTNIHNYLSMA